MSFLSFPKPWEGPTLFAVRNYAKACFTTIAFAVWQVLSSIAGGGLEVEATSSSNYESYELTDLESELIYLILNDEYQGRDLNKVQIDILLCKVARDYCKYMVENNHYGHVDLEGRGSNQRVRDSGYYLDPARYGNAPGQGNVESLMPLRGVRPELAHLLAIAAYESWLQSPGHRSHVLAETDSWKKTVAIGVGIYYDPVTWRGAAVFLSADPDWNRYVLGENPKQSVKIITTSGGTRELEYRLSNLSLNSTYEIRTCDVKSWFPRLLIRRISGSNEETIVLRDLVRFPSRYYKTRRLVNP